jgi:hypothetical protein
MTGAASPGRREGVLLGPHIAPVPNIPVGSTSGNSGMGGPSTRQDVLIAMARYHRTTLSVTRAG